MLDIEFLRRRKVAKVLTLVPAGGADGKLEMAA